MSYPGAGIVGGTHLVISKHLGFGKYKPELVFTMYLPPTGFDIAYRLPHSVSAGIGSVHVDSGRMLLADLTVEIDHGVGTHLYTNARTGLPQVMNGLSRSKQLREVLAKASQLVAARTHRLEFHNEKRDVHVQVVPVGQHKHSWMGGSGRVGGGKSSLSFVIVKDLKGSVDPIAPLDDFYQANFDFVSQALGTGSVYLNLVANAADRVSPVSRFRQLTDTLVSGVSQVFSSFNDLVNVGRSHTNFNIEMDLISQLKTLVSSYQSNVIDSLSSFMDAHHHTNRASAYFGELKSQVDILERLSERAGKLHDRQITAGSGSSLTKYEQSIAKDRETDTKMLPLMGGGGSGGGLMGGSGLKMYSGWVPHPVKDGQTLEGIAFEMYSDPSKWPIIASLNGIPGNPFIYPGMVLKIPVKFGGYSFDIDEYSDPEAMKDAIYQHVYFRDLLLKEEAGASGAVDLVLSDDLMDVKTVTGPDNYVQRYRHIVFKTDLGANPEFPFVGIFMGLGDKMLAGNATLTKQSAQTALLADPRTRRVKPISLNEMPDGVQAAFSVVTTSSNVPSSLLLGGS